MTVMLCDGCREPILPEHDAVFFSTDSSRIGMPAAPEASVAIATRVGGVLKPGIALTLHAAHNADCMTIAVQRWIAGLRDLLAVPSMSPVPARQAERKRRGY